MAGIIGKAVGMLRPPVRGLCENERKRLGGLLFQGAAQFVNRMSDLLRERPDLSPDPARVNAALLAGRNLRAYGWALLHAVLTDLAELANDCYLYEQGSAVEEAQQVLKAHEIRLADTFLRERPDLELIRDGGAIEHARSVLRRHEERQHQRQLRHARALKKARQKLARSPEKEPVRKQKKGGGRGSTLLRIADWGRRRLDP